MVSKHFKNLPRMYHVSYERDEQNARVKIKPVEGFTKAAQVETVRDTLQAAYVDMLENRAMVWL